MIVKSFQNFYTWLRNWVETWKLAVKQHCTEDTANLDPSLAPSNSVKRDQLIFKDSVGALKATRGLRALPTPRHPVCPGCPGPAQLHGGAGLVHSSSSPASGSPSPAADRAPWRGMWRCRLGCRWGVVGQQTQPHVCKRRVEVTN